jgi:streptomycin 6-kinase
LLIASNLRQTILDWFGPEGQAWLAALPETVQHLAEEWGLEVGASFAGGSASLVLAVSETDGRRAVLKIPCLDDENRAEADALRHYGGVGAVRLYKHDPRTGAMLLERVTPGTSLAECPDGNQALDIACRLLRRLWRSPVLDHRFPLVRDIAARWANSMRAHVSQGGRLPDRLVNQAAEWASALAEDAGTEVVVNRDAHLGNILAAEREPWLLIDPKPLVGEPAFDAGYLVLDRLNDSPTPSQAAELAQRVAEGLEVEQDRVRKWAFVRAVENALWSLEVDASPQGYLAQATALLY